jgi:lipopolysaccharide biosynthesis regulator YciM
VFGELLRGGATPAELGKLVSNRNRYQLSQLLLANGMIDAAKDVVAAASDREGVEFNLTQAQIALQDKDLEAARLASQRALAIAPHDPRAVLIASDLELRANNRDRAIQILQDSLRGDNAQVDVSRKLLEMLMQTDRWQAIDHALQGLRIALAAAGASMLEANLAAAHIYESRGQYRRAISEYQAALTHNPDNIGLLFAMAGVAEQGGCVTAAIDAYNEILRHEPANPSARAALARIELDKKTLEVNRFLRSHTTEDDK